MSDKSIDITARHTKQIGPRLNHVVVQHAVRMRDRVVELLDREVELERLIEEWQSAARRIGNELPGGWPIRVNSKALNELCALLPGQAIPRERTKEQS